MPLKSHDVQQFDKTANNKCKYFLIISKYYTDFAIFNVE